MRLLDWVWSNKAMGWHVVCFRCVMTHGNVIQLFPPLAYWQNIPIHITSTTWSKTTQSEMLYIRLSNIKLSSASWKTEGRWNGWPCRCCAAYVHYVEWIRVQVISSLIHYLLIILNEGRIFKCTLIPWFKNHFNLLRVHKLTLFKNL